MTLSRGYASYRSAFNGASPAFLQAEIRVTVRGGRRGVRATTGAVSRAEHALWLGALAAVGLVIFILYVHRTSSRSAAARRASSTRKPFGAPRLVI